MGLWANIPATVVTFRHPKYSGKAVCRGPFIHKIPNIIGHNTSVKHDLVVTICMISKLYEDRHVLEGGSSLNRKLSPRIWFSQMFVSCVYYPGLTKSVSWQVCNIIVGNLKI